MSLDVKYTRPIGYFTETQIHDGDERQFRIYICQANCMCAFMHFYTENDTEKSELIGFFADCKHVRNTLKDIPGYFDGMDDFHFHPDRMNSDIWGFVKILAKLGKRITISKTKTK